MKTILLFALCLVLTGCNRAEPLKSGELTSKWFKPGKTFIKNIDKNDKNDIPLIGDDVHVVYSSELDRIVPPVYIFHVSGKNADGIMMREKWEVSAEAWESKEVGDIVFLNP